LLIAVASATIVVAIFGLAATGIAVLGPLPQGLPALRVPRIGVHDVVPILMGGVTVALVSFADTSVLSRSYAARLRTKVDPNQEMVALGAANLASGFFQGFPVSSSASRTPVAEAAGAKPLQRCCCSRRRCSNIFRRRRWRLWSSPPRSA
jgi:MFS superfamily sulfate permease-like transporter